MSLTVGELTAYLDVDRSAYQRGLREARGDLTRFGADAGRDTDRIGRDSGGKLAQGMRQGFIRNSPLIVAGIGAALTAGAPLVLSAATGLFSGVGIVAAAQADEVQSAWAGAWQNVKRSTISEASAIEPVLIGLADRVSDRFDDLQPQLGHMFDDAAPQIEVFADGVLDLADNALPGLFRAVERGMPVTRGLANFLADTGTGLSHFFDAISGHGPAAGQVFDQLGDTMKTLLPLLGELLGNGAELATAVLPLLNGSLGLVLDVVRLLGPALPLVAAGFLALKSAQTAGGWVGGLVDKLDGLDTGSGRARGAMDRLRGVMTPTNVVGGALGATFGLLVGAMQESEAQTRAWADGLNEGGQAARDALTDMREYAAAVEAMQGPVGNMANALLPGAAGAFSIYADDVDAAKEAHQAFLDSLSPIASAERDVRIATDELDLAIQQHGRNSPEAAAALDGLRAATDRLEGKQAQLESTISGVTEAMIKQQETARAAIDSQFAYEQALLDVNDAEKAYQDSLKDSDATRQDRMQAWLDWREAVVGVADAYAENQAKLSGLEEGTVEYDQYLNGQFLARLRELQKEAGPNMAQALGEMITGLENAGTETVSLHELADQLGISIDDLGAKDAKPTVSLNPKSFNATLNTVTGLLQSFGLAKAVPTADLNDKPLQGGYRHDLDLLSILTGQRPTPVANLNSGPFSGVFGRVMSQIASVARQRPTPTASLIDRISGAVSGIVSRLVNIPNISRTVTITTINRQLTQAGIVPPQRAAGGPVWPGQDFLVGEQGPEIVRFPERGTVIPAGQTAAMLRGDAGRVSALAPTGGGTAAGFAAAGNAAAGAALHVHFDGPVLADRRSLQKTAQMLHTEFRAIERARS